MPITFVQGAAEDRHVPNGWADLAFADPPYNFGLTYADDPTGDRVHPGTYAGDSRDWIRRLADATRPGGTVWYLVPECLADVVGPLLTTIVGPRYRRIIWHERFAQYNDRGPTQEHRHLFVHRREPRLLEAPGDHYFDGDAIRVPSERQKAGDPRANPKGRVPGDVWLTRRLQGTSTDRVDWHPAQLPPEPLERMLLGWTPPGGRVFELFAGSGSLARVAARLGREYAGVERSGTYCERAAQRIRDERPGAVVEVRANVAALGVGEGL